MTILIGWLCCGVEPNFVSSYEIDEFVYFFFRETAVEFINCEKVSIALCLSISLSVCLSPSLSKG